MVKNVYHSFTPGNKSNLRQIIAKSIDNNSLCLCTPPQYYNDTQSYVNNSQSRYIRFAKTINTNLGGRTNYGVLNRPVTLNYHGGWEGQPGGIIAPPRNRF